MSNRAVLEAESATVTDAVVSTGLIIEIEPERIIVNPELDALRIREGQEYEDETVNLALTLFEEGQIHPGLVQETPDGYMLVAGQRRLSAIKMLRTEAGAEALGLSPEEAVEAAQMLYRAEVVPAMDGVRAFRLALIENIQHRHFTPMEIARNVEKVRKICGNNGKPGLTKDIADFMGMSTAYVTEHERLLKLPRDVQDDLQAGKISKSTALAFTEVKPEKVAEVKQLAQTKADKEAEKREAVRQEKETARAAKDAAKDKAAGRPERKHNPNPEIPKAKPGQVNKPKAGAKIEHKHLKAAAKELDAVATVRAPKMAELKQLLETWCGPAFPKPMVKFAEAMIKWTEGKMNDKQMTAVYDDIADLVGVREDAHSNKAVKSPTHAAHKIPTRNKALPIARKAARPAPAAKGARQAKK